MVADFFVSGSFYARACASENSRIQFKSGKGAFAWTDDHVRRFSSDFSSVGYVFLLHFGLKIQLYHVCVTRDSNI